MDDYVKGLVEEFPKKLGFNDVALTPATDEDKLGKCYYDEARIRKG